MKSNNNKFLCPICKKENATISFGIPDSVVCKCSGLKEVGRIKNGEYIPHNFNRSNGLHSCEIEIFPNEKNLMELPILTRKGNCKVIQIDTAPCDLTEYEFDKILKEFI